VLTATALGTYELAASTGGVTSVTASAPLASSGGATPDISLTGIIGLANGGTGAATLTQHAVLLGNGTSAISGTSLTNGQLLIGSTGNAPVAATLTDGTGVSITEGSGTITVAIGQAVGTSDAVTFSGVTVSGLTASQYVKTNGSSALASAATIPASDVTSIPYDLPAEIPGVPPVSTRIVNFIAVRPFTLLSSGHQGAQLIPASSNVVCTIKKNGTSISSTITFEGPGGGFSSSVTQTSFNIGDVLSVETPSAVNGIDTPFFTLAMTLG
jgi:hypothetical protein